MSGTRPPATHADRVRSHDWHEAGVTLPEVIAELTHVHAVLGRLDAGEGDHPHPRNVCMNLVAVVPERTHVERVQQLGREIAAQHPLRMLTLHLEAAHNTDRLDAWISSEAHVLAGGMPIQAELVRLEATGTAAGQPVTLVEALLVPDVPAYLWWLGTSPVAEPAFLEMLEVVDVLVVDSAGFERPFISTLELADLATAAGRRVAIGDLQWGRLLGWRELLAQLFTPAGRRPLLDGINGLGIDYVGEGRGNRVAAALLCGWLAEALGWSLQRAAAGTGGLVVAYYQAHGHPVEVDFRSVEGIELVDGEISAVRIDAAGGGKTGAFTVERDPERRSRVRVGIEIGEADRLEETRPMDSPDERGLLLDLFSQRRDTVYLGALAQAATLLRALH